MTNVADSSITVPSIVLAGGAQNSYQYNALNELTQVQQSGGGATAKQVNFAYNDDGSMDKVARYNGLGTTSPVVATTYYRSLTGTTLGGQASGYDGMGRVTGLVHRTSANVTIDAYTFAYDPASNMTQMVSTWTLGTNTTTDTSNYTNYDATHGTPIAAKRWRSAP
jgi:hypothetical protein